MTLSTHRAFDQDLAALEETVVSMSAAATAMVDGVASSLRTGRSLDPEAVRADDDVVDAAHLDVERRIVETIVRRQPVAGDLRRILALQQAALHLERIADLAVVVSHDLVECDDAPGAVVAGLLGDAARTVSAMTADAMSALREVDRDAALQLEQVNARLRGTCAAVLSHLVGSTDDVATALHLDRVSRSLERAGAHAVDIAEAAWFLSTGEHREFGRTSVVGDGD